MIPVDTSVWVDHLRASDKALAALLDSGAVLAHRLIVAPEARSSGLGADRIVQDALDKTPVPV